MVVQRIFSHNLRNHERFSGPVVFLGCIKNLWYWPASQVVNAMRIKGIMESVNGVRLFNSNCIDRHKVRFVNGS